MRSSPVGSRARDRFPFRPPLFASILLIVAAQAAGAQATPSVLVQVHVRGTSGRAIAGAEILVVTGLNAVRASTMTDDRGRAELRVAVSKAPNQLVVRKIGFTREDRFFSVARDSLSFDISLHRIEQTLSAVVVTAEQDAKRKSYHIDAEDIANSTHALVDAADILARERPDMICGRSCSPMSSVRLANRNPDMKCPTLQFQDPPRLTCLVDDAAPSLVTNVWVNGRRVRMVALNEHAVFRQTGMLAGLLPGTMTVLSEIKPEHVSEITYVDELDSSVGKIGSAGALFIVLKVGIAYEPGNESHLAPEIVAPAPEPPPPVLPRYRYRVLGVFDRLTGKPITGADVIDMKTGTKARTTRTGTVSLVFLPEGGTPLRISKRGYEDLTVAVEISPETEAPLTLLMTRRP